MIKKSQLVTLFKDHLSNKERVDGLSDDEARACLEALGGSGETGDKEAARALASGLSRHDFDFIAEKMGESTRGQGIRRKGTVLELGMMTKEQARAHLAKLEEVERRGR
jgi:hypothetical protein